MRRPLWLLASVLVWACMVGMASPRSSTVPRPETNFKSTVKDDQDISTKIENSSWDGDIFFSGTRGKGTVTIPFEKVKKAVAVGTGKQGKRDFQITLRNGDTVAVSFDEGARFTGTTSFGTYTILSKNIKEITFE